MALFPRRKLQPGGGGGHLPKPPPRRRSGSLVVVEWGASWPRWLDPTQTGHVIVVAQHYEGSPESILTQVASRVSRVHEFGWRLDRALLSVSHRSEHVFRSARARLAQRLLGIVSEARGSELLLSVDQAAGPELAQELIDLSWELETEPAAANVRISLRLGEVLQEPAPLGRWGTLPGNARAS